MGRIEQSWGTAYTPFTQYISEAKVKSGFQYLIKKIPSILRQFEPGWVSYT